MGASITSKINIYIVLVMGLFSLGGFAEGIPHQLASIIFYEASNRGQTLQSEARNLELKKLGCNYFFDSAATVNFEPPDPVLTLVTAPTFTTLRVNDVKVKNWGNCCIKHDLAYWSGGTNDERVKADQELKDCVEKAGQPNFAKIMYGAVSIFGPLYFNYRQHTSMERDFTESELLRLFEQNQQNALTRQEQQVAK